MLARFHAPGLVIGAELVELPADEARHLTRVLRLGAGDEIAVFDGRGHEFRAVVAETGRRGVRVRLLDPIVPASENTVSLTLAQAVLKGDHMDHVVRDAVMMGVAAIQPIVTAHTQVALAALRRGTVVDRWHRVAVASAKQCRRATVPEILTPCALDAYLRVVDTEDRLCLMLVEPSVAAPAIRELEALRTLPRLSRADLVVGPEGGWSEAEVDAALQVRSVLLTLGHRTLRADAAAVVALALLLFAWGEL